MDRHILNVEINGTKVSTSVVALVVSPLLRKNKREGVLQRFVSGLKVGFRRNYLNKWFGSKYNGSLLDYLSTSLVYW